MPKKSGVSLEFNPGIDQLASRISSLPPVYIEEVMDEVGDYAVGVMKDAQPKRKYVSRMAAYGKTWVSAKQRRFFMWAVSTGKIPGWVMTKDGPRGQYIRSGAMAEAWDINKTDDSFMLTNPTAAAFWTMGDQQARQPAMVGWKKAAKIIAGALTFRSSKFRQAVEVAYQRALRKVKLG